MPVFSSYFDASGAPKQGKYLVLAGFISTAQRWGLLEQRWAKVLAKFDVTEFHMTELAAGVGEFKGWKENRQTRFLALLAQIAAETVEYSFACVVVLDDWKLANQQYKLKQNKLKPYPLCGRTLVERVRYWCDRLIYDKEQTLFVFEKGDEDQGMLRDRVAQEFGVEVHFEGKKLPQLQVADLAAWHTHWKFKKTFDPAAQLDERFHETFVRLFTQIRYDHRYFSMKQSGELPASLVRFCEYNKVPRREAS